VDFTDDLERADLNLVEPPAKRFVILNQAGVAGNGRAGRDVLTVDYVMSFLVHRLANHQVMTPQFVGVDLLRGHHHQAVCILRVRVPQRGLVGVGVAHRDFVERVDYQYNIVIGPLLRIVLLTNGERGCQYRKFQHIGVDGDAAAAGRDGVAAVEPYLYVIAVFLQQVELMRRGVAPDGWQQAVVVAVQKQRRGIADQILYVIVGFDKMLLRQLHAVGPVNGQVVSGKKHRR